MMASVQGTLRNRLAWGIAFLAAAMLLLEFMVTRLFSVLFAYHFSFFAVSLVMSGLAFGGLAVSRLNVRAMDEARFRNFLAVLAMLFSAFTLVAVYAITRRTITNVYEVPNFTESALGALAFLPGLVLAGMFLAAAFARNENWIGGLYAADLTAAAIACLSAIFLMRTVQGPAMILAPALIAALAGMVLSARFRVIFVLCAALAIGSGWGMGKSLTTNGDFLRLKVTSHQMDERWNEHSRVFTQWQTDERPDNPGIHYRMLLIDKMANTTMPKLKPRAPGTPIIPEKWWSEGLSQVVYSLGRPLRDGAIIGVGGGRDLLAPLANGAQHVDGYELNKLILDTNRKVYPDYNGMARWPEINLIHNEARVGIRHSGKKYDFIQASMIDTWAATASGGFVLSENGLYTLDGWKIFLEALSETGVLSMSRWFLAATPAETHRLVALAATALENFGIKDVENHLIIAACGVRPHGSYDLINYSDNRATIMVSKAPFTAEEVARLQTVCAKENFALLTAPGLAGADPAIKALLDPVQRAELIQKSVYDISPTTDERPYFFLQIRPRDLPRLFSKTLDPVGEISYNGIRVLMFMVVASLTLAGVLMLFVRFTLPSPSPTPEQRRTYNWMSIYFLGIGLGYILVQLGLHQRLIVILGHPTLALSVVLFSMLLVQHS